MSESQQKITIPPPSSFLTPVFDRFGYNDPFSNAGIAVRDMYKNNPNTLRRVADSAWNERVSHEVGMARAERDKRDSSGNLTARWNSGEYSPSNAIVVEDLVRRQKDQAERGTRYGNYTANALATLAVALPVAFMLNARKIQNNRRRRRRNIDKPQVVVKSSALDATATPPQLRQGINPDWYGGKDSPTYDHAVRLMGEHKTLEPGSHIISRTRDRISGFIDRAPDDLDKETTPWQDSMYLPAAVFGTGALAYGSYKLMDWMTDRIRARQLQREREKLRQEYMGLLQSGLSKKSSLAASLDAAAASFEKSAGGWSDIAKNIALLVGLGSFGVGAYRGFPHGRKESETRAKKKALELAVKRMQMARPPVVSVYSGTSPRQETEYRAHGFVAPQDIDVALPLDDDPIRRKKKDDDDKKKSLLSFPV